MNELERCEPWIRKALKYANGTHTFDDVVKGVIDARLQLWPGEHACLVSEILQFPQRRIGNAFLAGGDPGLGMKELHEMTPDMTAWAKDRGCDGVMLSGRKGWVKHLPEWREHWTVLTKDI